MAVRVLIICGQTMFGRGIECLLGPDVGVQVVGRESDLQRALQSIAELKPDVVLLDGSSMEDDPMPALVSSLRDRPGTRIIGLNLQNNCMCIYSGEQRTIRDVDDLVGAIRERIADSSPRKNLS